MVDKKSKNTISLHKDMLLALYKKQIPKNKLAHLKIDMKIYGYWKYRFPANAALFDIIYTIIRPFSITAAVLQLACMM
jgi:hypothetical protein